MTDLRFICIVNTSVLGDLAQLFSISPHVKGFTSLFFEKISERVSRSRNVSVRVKTSFIAIKCDHRFVLGRMDFPFHSMSDSFAV